jgi:hypothetical protein
MKPSQRWPYTSTVTSAFAARDVRRASLAIVGIALVAVALAGPAPRLAALVGAGDWGSDWRWLEDGLRRLAAGLPLTRPEYVAGPFSQFNPGPTYAWSLHPPFSASLLAPALLLPDSVRQAAWTLLMAGALLAAFWLAWPRRLWWGTHLLIGCAALGSAWLGLWAGPVDQVHYANPNALVALGVVLTWQGRRRGSAALIALGLVLAAMKIVPALALGCWLLASWRRVPAVRHGVALAVVALVGLTVPILVLDPGALGDTIRAEMNLIPLANATNLAPRLLLAPILGPEVAAAVSYGIPLALYGLVLLRRMDGPAGLVIAISAALFLMPQLWAHWFIIPAIAALIAAGEWPLLRRLDAALRGVWERPELTVPVHLNA